VHLSFLAVAKYWLEIVLFFCGEVSYVWSEMETLAKADVSAPQLAQELLDLDYLFILFLWFRIFQTTHFKIKCTIFVFVGETWQMASNPEGIKAV